MTDEKHASEDGVEDLEARPDAETAADNDSTESPGERAGADASDLTAADEEAAAEEAAADEEAAGSSEPKRRVDFSRIAAFAVLPALAFLLAIGAGLLKFMDSGVRDSDTARDRSIQAAKDSTVALLSYQPDTVEQQLTAARDRLTGEFRDQYTELTNNVVIPGAKQKQISAVASVPAAASVSADPGKAVVLVFVNQTVTVGNGVPTDTASSVRITLEKSGERWLISEFEPV